MREALAGCGVKAEQTPALGQVAADTLGASKLADALVRQGYRPHEAREWSATYHGDLAWVRRTLAAQCGEWQGYRESGLATDGTRLSLILATPARVDLKQSRRWLSDFLAATNQARAQAQKCGGETMKAAPPLRWNEQLEAAAARHATEMVQLDFRGHVNPKDGSTPMERAAAAGFRGSVGENIQYGAITPAEAVRNLLGSPGHCKNLMEPRWTSFGAAVNNGTAKTLFATYWVQVFGAQ